MMWRRTASFYRGASLPLPDPISAVFFYLTFQEKGHTQEEEHVVIIIVLRDVLLVAGRGERVWTNHDSPWRLLLKIHVRCMAGFFFFLAVSC